MNPQEIGTVPIEVLAPGMSRSISKVIGEAEIESFAVLSEDRNPIHLCDESAAASPFGERIAHGMLSAALFSAIIGERLPGHGTIYLGQSLRFRAPVKVGDEVTATITVLSTTPERRRATLLCEARVGETLVIDGEAEVLVPTAAALPANAAAAPAAIAAE
ncbi:MAG: MaoC family dehydratase [Hasllibacter sp.]